MYYIAKIFKEMSHIYAKFINQYKFKYQLSFKLLFYKFEKMVILKGKQKCLSI